jgi:hypothetical protein
MCSIGKLSVLVEWHSLSPNCLSFRISFDFDDRKLYKHDFLKKFPRIGRIDTYKPVAFKKFPVTLLVNKEDFGSFEVVQGRARGGRSELGVTLNWASP